MSNFLKSITKDLEKAGDSLVRSVEGSVSSVLLSYFRTNNVVQLISRSSGRSLQICVASDGKLIVDGNGPPEHNFPHTHWTVLDEGQNNVKLFNQTNYLAIVGGTTKIVSYPSPQASGPETRFRVKQRDSNFVCLESLVEAHRHVGVIQNGQMKSAVATGTEIDGQFGVLLIHTPYADQSKYVTK